MKEKLTYKRWCSVRDVLSPPLFSCIRSHHKWLAKAQGLPSDLISPLSLTVGPPFCSGVLQSHRSSLALLQSCFWSPGLGRDVACASYRTFWQPDRCSEDGPDEQFQHWAHSQVQARSQRCLTDAPQCPCPGESAASWCPCITMRSWLGGLRPLESQESIFIWPLSLSCGGAGKTQEDPDPQQFWGR